MARGGARPGAGRPAGKSANTSPPSTRARARARGGSENQRPWPADKVQRWSIDRLIPYGKNARTHSDAQDRRDSREHQGVGLDDAGARGRGRWPDWGPRQDTRRPAARHRRNPRDGRRGLERGAEAGVRPGR